jgi:hypothetical protein
VRDGQRQTIHATPARNGNEGLLGIGIGDETVKFKPGLKEAITYSFEKNVEYSQLIFQTLWGLFTRETSPKQLMGPVAIAQLSGEAASLSWIALFSLMASISLNLGLLNLMADSRPRWRTHLHHGARGSGAPRLQHARQREDAAGRLCPHPDADGDSHL